MARIGDWIRALWDRYDRWQTRLPSPLRFTARELLGAAIVCFAIVTIVLALGSSGGVLADVEAAIATKSATETAQALLSATPTPTATATATRQATPTVAPTTAPTQAPTARPQNTPTPASSSQSAPVVATPTATTAPAPPPSSPAPAAVAAAPANRPETSSRGGAAVRGERTIVIDPGHGGKETGAVRQMPDGTTLKEKAPNLTVALAVADLLRQAGHKVVLTRTTDAPVNAAGKDLNGNGGVDVSDDLQARIDVANNAKANLFVSIHFNAGNTAAKGTEVFYNANRPFADKSRQLAQSVYDRLIAAIKAYGYPVVGRGVKKDSQATGGAPFFVLGPQGGIIARAAGMPAMLGEGLFISNLAEAQLVSNVDFLNTVARAYADGILDYIADGN